MNNTLQDSDSGDDEGKQGSRFPKVSWIAFSKLSINRVDNTRLSHMRKKTSGLKLFGNAKDS